ncbi:MAG: hypothetical protein SGI77_00880 [Pirellulaceae bacterium]|nr:hypothetical protein [Pirellulaceae bacterium]
MQATPLVHPTLLFEFSVNLKRLEKAANKPSSKRSTKAAKQLSTTLALLDERYRLPSFSSLGHGASQSPVYVGWSEEGLSFQTIVTGKAKLPRFVQERGGFSDGLRVWIDTRNSPGIHRATRFCHCFHFFPGLPNSTTNASIDDRARGIMDEIARAKEHPTPIDPSDLLVQSEFTKDGYALLAHIPTKCLTGYSPLEFDRISFFCDVVDQELGTQSIVLGSELRYAEDPSLWVQAILR